MSNDHIFMLNSSLAYHSSNVWYSMANEWDKLNKTIDEWDELFETLNASNPFPHETSIHNWKAYYVCSFSRVKK
jgi:hypothetical protein